MITRQQIIDIFTALRDKEYYWLSTDAPPTPAVGARAFGAEVDVVTHELTTKYWTGAAWADLA